ncbi:MAG: RNA polymerase sigma factor [Psychroflexus maritimus]
MIKKLSSSVCDDQVYKDLYNEHAQDLFKHFYYKFGNVEWAEDVVQESFIKLWKKCEDVPLPKVKSFLYTIANNWLINKHHHQKVKLKYKNEYQGRTEDEQTPAYLLEEEEFKARLLTAINKLTTKQRSVFLLHRIDQKTYKEIAAIEQISVKAIEKRMSKALKSLRNDIENL